MYSFLRAHPDLFLPDVPECNHFGTDLHCIAGKRMPMEQYLGLFQDADQTQLCGEKSVFYLISRSAANEIRDFATDPKIIVMVRDSVEMMYALHSQLVYTGHEPILNFEDALEAESARAGGDCLPPNGWWREMYEYRRLASYSEQIEHYFNVFGRDRVLVVIQEELQRKPAEEYRKVLEFLGTRVAFLPEFRQVNVNRRIVAPRLYAALWRPPRYLLNVGRLFPVAFRRNLLNLFREKMVYNAPRSPMRVETRNKLREEFRQEAVRLGDLLGRELSWCGLDP
jgi:hypothetical protein